MVETGVPSEDNVGANRFVEVGEHEVGAVDDGAPPLARAAEAEE